MVYQVKQRFGVSPEKQIAEFRNLNEAKTFVEEKLSSDLMYKLNTTYRIYHYGEDLLEEWTPEKWQKMIDAQHSANDSSNATGAQSQSSFRPTPLPTSPRPPGMPASVFKKEDEDQNK